MQLLWDLDHPKVIKMYPRVDLSLLRKFKRWSLKSSCQWLFNQTISILNPVDTSNSPSSSNSKTWWARKGHILKVTNQASRWHGTNQGSTPTKATTLWLPKKTRKCSRVWSLTSWRFLVQHSFKPTWITQSGGRQVTQIWLTKAICRSMNSFKGSLKSKGGLLAWIEHCSSRFPSLKSQKVQIT